MTETAPNQSLDVIMIPLTEIRPYWRNPRNNEKAIQGVMRSINDYGMNQPLVLDEDRVIIVGHSRYKALMNLGWTEAPCVISHISPEKAKEYRIIDNKTSELAEWDKDNLVIELREFENLPDFQEFFPEVDLDKLVGDSVGLSYKDPTDESLERTERKMGTVFEDRNKAALADLIEVICPHCEEIFSVSREDLLKRLH